VDEEMRHVIVEFDVPDCMSKKGIKIKSVGEVWGTSVDDIMDDGDDALEATEFVTPCGRRA